MSLTLLPTSTLRSHFPALVNSSFVYGDNAGGSQICQPALSALTDYLVGSNTQMGSGYMPLSTERCTVLAQEKAAKLFGDQVKAEEIVFGSSTTQNLENLVRGLEDKWQDGEEVIVTGEHEANTGPWKKLATRKQAVLKTWPFALLDKNNPYSLNLRVDELLPLISAKTRIIAFTACSNILGSILPVQYIVAAIRKRGKEVGATKLEICLDCVAYAPHRRMDVKPWDVDYAVFSFYKVYGPHVSAMYVRHSSLTNSVSSIVHHFLSPAADSTGYKLQPAGPGYESVWGGVAVVSYLESLTSSGSLDEAYEAISAHDAKLAEQFLAFLTSEKAWKRGVRVVGEGTPGPSRMPTVSFVVKAGSDGQPAIKSNELVEYFDAIGKIGIRFGHFYAYGLVSQIRPEDPNDGVVRVSFVHYNTEQEVKGVIETLQEFLFSKEKEFS